jgi:hypothetical protein
VVVPANRDRVRAWRAAEGLGDVLVLADPTRSLAHALGARRPSPLRWVFAPRNLLRGARELLAGHRPRAAPGDDVALMGVDVVTDAARDMTLARRAASAGDRVPPAALIAAVTALARA